jgi:hypothetical protein
MCEFPSHPKQLLIGGAKAGVKLCIGVFDGVLQFRFCVECLNAQAFNLHQHRLVGEQVGACGHMNGRKNLELDIGFSAGADSRFVLIRIWTSDTRGRHARTERGHTRCERPRKTQSGCWGGQKRRTSAWYRVAMRIQIPIRFRKYGSHKRTPVVHILRYINESARAQPIVSPKCRIVY